MTPAGSGSGGSSTARRPGEATWFVYGFDGELVAEYAWNQVAAPQKEYGYRVGKLLIVWDGTQAGDDQLKWLVTDQADPEGGGIRQPGVERFQRGAPGNAVTHVPTRSPRWA